MGQQVGHLLGEDLAQQGFQLAVGVFGLLLLQPGMGVVVGQQVDFYRVAGVPIRGNLQNRRPAQAAMGEQDILAKALAVAAHQAVDRGAGQLAAQLLELVGDGERHEPGAGRQQFMAELPGHLVTETGGAQRRDRQTARGDHQGFTAQFTQGGLQLIAAFELGDCLDGGVQVQAHAGLDALVEQHAEDVAGLVVAEQLAEFLLVVRHAVLGHQPDEIPLCITGQGRFAEVRVVREEVGRLGVHVGEVAAAATGHQDFLAGLVGVVDQHHLAPTPGGGQRAHQACGAGANDHNFGRAHSHVLTKLLI